MFRSHGISKEFLASEPNSEEGPTILRGMSLGQRLYFYRAQKQVMIFNSTTRAIRNFVHFVHFVYPVEFQWC